MGPEPWDRRRQRVRPRSRHHACFGLAAAALTCCLGAQDDTGGAAVDPAAELARVVDLPEPSARRAAARELAALEVGIDEWLAAMRAFAPAAPPRPGQGRETVPCWNGESLEDTEIDWLVPPTIALDAPAPLMVTMHGTGGSGRGFPGRSWPDEAHGLGMIVIAPSESGPNDGYAYTERERQVTLAAVRWARRRWNIDENRVFLSGISRGGHLTWDLALRHPDRFAAIVPIIGGPRINPTAAQNNLRYLENVAHLPIRDLQGARDDPALVFTLRLAFEELRGMQARDAVLVEFPDLDHGYDKTVVDWADFLGRARRDPLPDRVVRMAAREGEGRAFWVDVLATDTREVQEVFRLRIDAKKWDALDEEGKRRWMADEVHARTARVEALLSEPGDIRLEEKYVRKVRLLLVPDMLDADGRLVVRYGARTKRFRPAPDPAVLLEEFVQRFDRTFLPTMAVELRM